LSIEGYADFSGVFGVFDLLSEEDTEVGIGSWVQLAHDRSISAQSVVISTLLLLRFLIIARSSALL